MQVKTEVYREYQLDAVQPDIAWQVNVYATRPKLLQPPQATGERFKSANEAHEAGRAIVDRLLET